MVRMRDSRCSIQADSSTAVIILIINAIAVLSEDRFLARSSSLPSFHRAQPRWNLARAVI